MSEITIECFPSHIQEILMDLDNWWYIFHPPILICKWCYKEVETPIILWYGKNDEYMIAFHPECCSEKKCLELDIVELNDGNFEPFIEE